LVACKDREQAPKPTSNPTPVQPAAADELTPEERAKLAEMSPLPAVPPDPTNAYADDPKAARLGQMLFFDKSFSGPLLVGDDGTNGELGKAGEVGKVSCATCHDGPGLDDRRPGSHVSR